MHDAESESRRGKAKEREIELPHKLSGRRLNRRLRSG
jgi:hypothetical protein